MAGRFRFTGRSNFLTIIPAKHWNSLLPRIIGGFKTKIRQPFVWDSCSQQGIELEDLQGPFQPCNISDSLKYLSSTRTFLAKFLLRMVGFGCQSSLFPCSFLTTGYFA